MTTFTIKDFPTDVRLRIRAEATLRGLSNAEMLTIICNDWFSEHALTISHNPQPNEP